MTFLQFYLLGIVACAVMCIPGLVVIKKDMCEGGLEDVRVGDIAQFMLIGLVPILNVILVAVIILRMLWYLVYGVCKHIMLKPFWDIHPFKKDNYGTED